MRNILYTAGSHGNFIRYLFDCYDQKKIIEFDSNSNGNFHGHIEQQSNRCYDFSYGPMEQDYQKTYKPIDTNYVITWTGIREFNYVLQCALGRGGHLKLSGIDLLEQDVVAYESLYYGQTDLEPKKISKILKNIFDFDCATNGKPPRALLRNYFLLVFIEHFDHISWKKNEQLKKTKYEIINLYDILNYDLLRSRLNKIFGYSIDFKQVHKKFLKENTPFQQQNQIDYVLSSIEQNKFKPIQGLNIVSEAFILFQLETQHFDIPFTFGNDFFKNTKDINEYIKYFPNYLKKPNNLFQQHYQIYKKNVDL